MQSTLRLWEVCASEPKQTQILSPVIFTGLLFLPCPLCLYCLDVTGTFQLVHGWRSERGLSVSEGGGAALGGAAML